MFGKKTIAIQKRWKRTIENKKQKTKKTIFWNVSDYEVILTKKNIHSIIREKKELYIYIEINAENVWLSSANSLIVVDIFVLRALFSIYTLGK